MPKDSTTKVPDMERTLRVLSQLPAPAAFMAPQAQVAWSTQKALMDEWERYAHAWFERRREAADSARRCMEQVQKSGTSDGAQVNEAMGDMNSWLSDELQRLSADAVENMEFCMRCFGVLAQGATSAGAELGRKTEKTSDDAAKGSGAGSKTTPV